jgi:hypothetical protein
MPEGRRGPRGQRLREKFDLARRRGTARKCTAETAAFVGIGMKRERNVPFALQILNRDVLHAAFFEWPSAPIASACRIISSGVSRKQDS